MSPDYSANPSSHTPQLAGSAGLSSLPATALTPAAATSTVVPTTVAPTLTPVATTVTAASATATTEQPEISADNKIATRATRMKRLLTEGHRQQGRIIQQIQGDIAGQAMHRPVALGQQDQQGFTHCWQENSGRLTREPATEYSAAYAGEGLCPTLRRQRA